MQKSYDQFVCLAGMPRAGSTLLAAILSQNPQIHTSGNSPMCQMMWDTYLSYQDRCSREFASNGKNDMLPKIIGQIPHVYYSDAFVGDLSGQDVSCKKLFHDISDNKMRVVIDRCRSWTSESNLNMLRSAVDPNIKVIVMDRSLQSVMESYARLFSTNNIGSALEQVLPQLLQAGTEPVMRAWELVKWSRSISRDSIVEVDQDVSGDKVETNTNPYKDMFCFVTYDELVDSPTETLARIYAHCGWEPFVHDFEKITMKNPEDEKVYGLVGQYKIREKLERSVSNVCDSSILPNSVLEKIWEIEGKMVVTV